jgi:hypothetical protein
LQLESYPFAWSLTPPHASFPPIRLFCQRICVIFPLQHSIATAGTTFTPCNRMHICGLGSTSSIMYSPGEGLVPIMCGETRVAKALINSIPSRTQRSSDFAHPACFHGRVARPEQPRENSAYDLTILRTTRPWASFCIPVATTSVARCRNGQEVLSMTASWHVQDDALVPQR